eukprot:6193395-Pleurochrysis_carterae.AAC.3
MRFNSILAWRQEPCWAHAASKKEYVCDVGLTPRLSMSGSRESVCAGGKCSPQASIAVEIALPCHGCGTDGGACSFRRWRAAIGWPVRAHALIIEQTACEPGVMLASRISTNKPKASSIMQLRRREGG